MQRLLDGLEAFQVQVLFALEFVGAVGVADGDGQRIHAGFLDEFARLLRIGVMAACGIAAAFFAFVELRADELAQFAFHDAIMLVGVFDDLSGRSRRSSRTARGWRQSSRW